MNKNENKSETNLTLRYYALGAQIIKDLRLRMIYFLEQEKYNWSWSD